MKSNLQRVCSWLDAVQQQPGAPGRDEAIKEIIWLAMKADTLDLLDEKGLIPRSLTYREDRIDPRNTQDLEGEIHEHGN